MIEAMRVIEDAQSTADAVRELNDATLRKALKDVANGN